MSRVLRRERVALGAICAAALLCALAAAGFAKKLPAKPIDLNRATLAQLEELPGIGPSKARAILEFREKSGPFERVEDLLALPGIGTKRFEKLRPYIIVSPPPSERKRKGSGGRPPKSAWNAMPRPGSPAALAATAGAWPAVELCA